MPAIYVCALSQVDFSVRAIGATTMVTLLSVGTEAGRPEAIAYGRHLRLTMSDVVDPGDGHVMPSETHVSAFLDFVRAWDQLEPMLIHCYAGVSRSTAAAFIAVCALRPDQTEGAIARRLRLASPTATPNRKLVALADHALGRDGRMIAAVASIGRGASCFEGTAFSLPLEAARLSGASSPSPTMQDAHGG